MPTARKPRLLIVDDEANVARTLQMVFEGEGYQASTAYSCAEAVELLQNGHRFEAVITDLNMEKPDVGLEVARVAKALQPPAIVVICTGFASTSNSREALDMQVDYLATKPVRLEDLIPALNRLIQRQRERRSRK